MKNFDLKELSEYDGKDGKPAYVARDGKVYDVSGSRLWKSGSHMKLHQAGRDLSAHFSNAPHGEEVFGRYPQVGLLERREEAQRKIPEPLAGLLKRFPFLRRHPHPMTVHFPIVFMFSTTAFNLLYLVTGIAAFEVTALHCLGAGIVFTPVAILTGLYTWWLNYMARPLRAVTVKEWASVILFVLELILFGWRIAVPDVLGAFDPAGIIYFLLVLSLLPLVTVIGWFGATLTFPFEKE